MKDIVYCSWLYKLFLGRWEQMSTYYQLLENYWKKMFTYTVSRILSRSNSGNQWVCWAYLSNMELLIEACMTAKQPHQCRVSLQHRWQPSHSLRGRRCSFTCCTHYHHQLPLWWQDYVHLRANYISTYRKQWREPRVRGQCLLYHEKMSITSRFCPEGVLQVATAALMTFRAVTLRAA